MTSTIKETKILQNLEYIDTFKRQIERASLRYEKFHEDLKELFESLESDLQKIFNGEEREHNSEPKTNMNDQHAKNPAEEESKENPFEVVLKVRGVQIR